MKKLLFPALMLTLAAVILCVLPTEAEAMIYEDTVRLHILANSDSVEDQELKLEVRDAVLAEYGNLLTGEGDADAAEALLREKAGEIEGFCRGIVAERGYDARVELGTEWYNTREYGDFSLPCGYYRSLRIVIGEGDGQNWWCVMYPPMCLGMSLTDAYSEEEEALIVGNYRVKFKLLELISEICR